MIQYIYFVKCPNCEDEHFDFFDEAKEYAMSCLSKNPIITQVEVCRNDFGECTDSTDLGTIWSSDYVIADTEKATTDGSGILTKDFLDSMDVENDPEFAALDNSVEPEEPVAEPAGEPSETSEISALDEIPDNFKKPLLESRFGVYFKTQAEWDEFKKLCDEIGIYTMGDVESFMKHEGATPDNLLAKLRDYRAELGPDFKIKESRKPVPEGMTIEQLVEEMEENEDMVECTWCNDLFPKYECRKEVDLGYLCSRCEAAIKSRGEKLTFVENDYWDFLDEAVAVADSAAVGKYLRLVKNNSPYHDDGTDFTLYDIKSLLKSSKTAQLTISQINLIVKFDNHCKVIRETDKGYLVTIPCYYRNRQDRSKLNETPIYVNCWVPKNQAELLNETLDESWLKQGDRFTIDRGNGAERYIVMSTSGNSSDAAKNDRTVSVAKEDEDGDYTDYDDITFSELATLKNKGKLVLESADSNTYIHHLATCPECGAEKSFDHETGVCNNCGFIL